MTTIRAAQPQDAAAVAEIYNQGMAERGATFEVEPRTAVGTYEKHGRLDGRWIDVVIVERLIPEVYAAHGGTDATTNRNLEQAR